MESLHTGISIPQDTFFFGLRVAVPGLTG
jgi:hypothetical protein